MKETGKIDIRTCLTRENMTEEISWDQFRETGFLWYVNTILQPFGLSIYVEYNEDGDFIGAHPTRTAFRGFSEEIINSCCEKMVDYVEENADELREEI